jgi:PAS domain S-box-containing protein
LSKDSTREELGHRIMELTQKPGKGKKTEEKLLSTEEMLRKSEEKYRVVVEHANEAILVAQDGMIKFSNPKCTDFTGYSQDELISKPFVDFIHPDDRDMITERYQRRLSGEHLPHVYPFRIIDKAGNTRWFEINAVMISWEGRPATLNFLNDITERKHAEDALRRQEEQLRTITANMPGLISYIDADGYYRFVNEQYEEWFGISRKNIVGKHYRLVLGNAVYKLIKTRIKTALSGKRVHYEEALPYKYGGKRWVDAEYVPDIDEMGKVKGFFALVTDITEHKQAEAKLIRSHEQLHKLADHLQSVREEERTNMAREIHDELGQALTGLKMDLSWLTRQMPYDQTHILEKIDTMSELIGRTQKVVQRISSELRPGLLDDLGLIAAIEWQAEEFKKRTGITCSLRIEPRDITIDERRATVLVRIFQETLTNVARHAQATRVSVSLKEKDGDLKLRVRDNGTGITKEQISDPKSFGLIGIKERVFSWGGKVTISGRPGKGTTVVARMPIKD